MEGKSRSSIDLQSVDAIGVFKAKLTQHAVNWDSSESQFLFELLP